MLAYRSFVSIIETLKPTKQYETFRATVCSNHWREPIKFQIEWMIVYDWFSPTVAANSYTEIFIVYIDLDTYAFHYDVTIMKTSKNLDSKSSFKKKLFGKNLFIN